MWLTTLFLTLTSSVTDLANAVLCDPPSTRIHVRKEGDALKLTVYREHRFSSERELLDWMQGRTGAPKDEPIVLQVDQDTKLGATYSLLEALTKLGFTKIELAVPESHETYIQAVGEGAESKKMVSFGGWLHDYYVKEFGEKALHFMWKDLNRALLEKKSYLALNLMFSLPHRVNASGKELFYAKPAPGITLDDQALKNYLALILGDPKKISRKMLVDELATINARRAVQFLIDYVADEKNPFYPRSAAIRTLQRLRFFERAVRSHQPNYFMMYHKDTVEMREQVRKDLAAIREWWKGARARFPKQLFPDQH